MKPRPIEQTAICDVCGTRRDTCTHCVVRGKNAFQDWETRIVLMCRACRDDTPRYRWKYLRIKPAASA